MARAIIPPEVAAKAGKFNTAEWVPAFSSFLKDDVFPTLIERYGYGDRIFDFANLANQTTTIKNRNLRVFEEGSMEVTVSIEEAIATGAAGADITFRVSTDNIDTQGNIPLRLTDDIIIPAQYQTGGEDRLYNVITITKNSSTDVDVVARPWNKAGTTVSAAQIGVEIPIGTTLSINGGTSGIGTGQPEGRTRNWFERNYKTKIIKETCSYEGGIGSYDSWINPENWAFKELSNGRKVATYLGSTQMEYDFNKKKAVSMFLSEENDNTALTSVSQSGGTNAIPSTKGVWNWAEEAGQDLTHNGSFDIEDMADIRDLLRSQLVTNTEVMFWTGSELDRQIQAACLGYMKEFSGGSNLLKGMKDLGVNIQSFLYNGVTFHFKSCADFENPQRYGGNAYDWTKRGLIYPLSQGMTRFGNKEKEMTPNLIIGYVEDEGVVRDNIYNVVDGMTGHDKASNEYDVRNVYQLSEMANIVLRPNQLIRVVQE